MIRHELRMSHPHQAGRFVVWDLTEARYRIETAAGAVVSSGIGPRVATGIEGMGGPGIDVFARETPRGAGRVRTGTRPTARSAFLPVVFSQTGQDWVTVQRLFWACLSPDRESAWRVYAPDGSWRELLVFLDENATVYAHDPTQIRQIVGVALTADNPFWMGPEQTAVTAVQPSVEPFFGGSNAAPPFYIVPGAQDGSTGLTVAGDVEAWPTLTILGPASAFSTQPLFVEAAVSAEIPVSGSEQLVIDFDPTAQAAMLRAKTATSGGTNVTAQLTGRAFFPIAPTFEPDVQVVLLTLAGAGEARLTYRPKYWRAI